MLVSKNGLPSSKLVGGVAYSLDSLSSCIELTVRLALGLKSVLSWSVASVSTLGLPLFWHLSKKSFSLELVSKYSHLWGNQKLELGNFLEVFGGDCRMHHNQQFTYESWWPSYSANLLRSGVTSSFVFTTTNIRNPSHGLTLRLVDFWFLHLK